MKATLEYDLDVQKEAKAFAAAQDTTKIQRKADRNDAQDVALKLEVQRLGTILEDPNLPKHDRDLVKPIYAELKRIQAMN